MGLFSSDDSEESSSSKRELTSIVSGDETVEFSCRSADGDDRRLVLTPTRIIIRWKSRGVSALRSEAAIGFARDGGFHRLTISDGSRGIGIQISEDDFERFWREYTVSMTDD